MCLSISRATCAQVASAHVQCAKTCGACKPCKDTNPACGCTRQGASFVMFAIWQQLVREPGAALATHQPTPGTVVVAYSAVLPTRHRLLRGEVHQ